MNSLSPRSPAEIQFSVGAHYDEGCNEFKDHCYSCYNYTGRFEREIGTIVNATKVIIHPK